MANGLSAFMERTSVCLAIGIMGLASAPSASALDLFWNDDVGIHRYQDANPTDPRLLFETYEARGMSVDAAHRQLWWSDVLPLGAPVPGGVIRTGRIDGGAIVDVVTHLTSPAGVAVDGRRGRVFWSDLGDAANSSAIFSAKLDGTDVQRLISAPWLSEIAGLALDEQHDLLYFTFINPLIDSLLAGGVARADLNGANVVSIVGGQGKPIGVAVDPVGGDVYWADALGLSPAGGSGAIKTIDFGGQHLRTVLGGLDAPQGVALDLAAQDVYWSDSGTGKVQRTSLPGVLPFFEDIVTALPAPTAIAIAAVPEPNGVTTMLLAAGILAARRTRSAKRRNRD